MTLVPFNKNDIEDLKTRNPKREHPIDLLVDFIKRDYECVEVLNYTYSNSQSCRSALATTIKRCGLVGIKVVKRGTRIFLIKEQ